MTSIFIKTLTGYIFGGPIGGLLGYMSVGIKIDENQPVNTGIDLLLLGAAVAKVSGENKDEKTSTLKKIIAQNVGEEQAKKTLEFLPKVMQEKYEAARLAADIKDKLKYGDKLTLISYLYLIAQFQNSYHPKELSLISIIANNLDIHPKDFLVIKNRMVKDAIITSSTEAHKILGVSTDASIKEITEKYRKLVLQYHPDKLSNPTPEAASDANIKMMKLKEAYEFLKKYK
jgi:uncharacterized tellurite resistance protein B-like protein